ncbi:2-oxoacid:acceptor oxidoreductase subunit alpha [bacterium]|nr:2-oxoacid:acceptor oxidoreductase subunit alpha [bacterium]MBU1074081.1 2-oxoacid:acceptor oxidoreductase subunit alpha [bacterium]MBU1676952.1 2-oxoacid:acceptor oxidoreductase subunit alpha [bacterium]
MSTEVIKQEDVVIRFAGDSGDGMQITGSQFTETTALVGNDLATFPDFPAEIRAPAGTRAGVSGFQIRFSSGDIFTPGDSPDVLVAMNPAALITNYQDLKPGGIVIANTDAFTEKDLAQAKLDTNPLEDGTLSAYRVIKIDISTRVAQALVDSPLNKRDVLRCKNFYTLGLMYWLFSRPTEPTLEWLAQKFAKRPELVEANQMALRAGYNAGNTLELFQGRFTVAPVENVPQGTYRNIMGNEALALGLVAGAELAGLRAFLGSYPITPATDILQYLSTMKGHGVVTAQMEDEIAGICTAIGASYAGMLGITTTSGPGLALKTEALGLAVMTELPLVVVDVQRAGPSTGMPTKVEQADLNQALYGRNSEAPLPVIACSSPADTFDCTVEACRLAVEYMTPVLLLSDNYIANGAEPWRLPDLDAMQPFKVSRAKAGDDFQPYARDERLVRPWAVPGTPGLQHRIGGLEKEHLTGNVSYDPDNHQVMVQYRLDKVLGIRDTIPTPQVGGAESGDMLVIGWGSTYGAIHTAVAKPEKPGQRVGHLHLRHLFPLPNGLAEIFARYEKILVPELNMGQLARYLTSEYPQFRFTAMHKVKGKPFKAAEIRARVTAMLEDRS